MASVSVRANNGLQATRQPSSLLKHGVPGRERETLQRAYDRVIGAVEDLVNARERSNEGAA